MRLLERIGWVLVWGTFALFNALLLTNHVRELLWLVLASLLPVWILTAAGGSVELAALLRARAKGGNDEGMDGRPAGGGGPGVRGPGGRRGERG